MDAKEYLQRARYLDNRIKAKAALLSDCNDLATKVTSVMSGMPYSPNSGGTRMADCVDKILDLRNEIRADLDELVEVKKDIMDTINKVENLEYQTLLEKHYLCYEVWEKVACDIGCSMRWLFHMRSEALKAVENVLEQKKLISRSKNA